MNIALDATYSIGESLSGVGLYSREILYGVAAEHPESRFSFYYRPHRYRRSFGEQFPPNARRRLLAEPLLGPRRADVFHGLNQRLPNLRMKRAVATFHDLFVITGEYSTPEFRARFTEQARDAARRADAIIAVSEFTRSQVVDLLGVDAARVRVVRHGTRPLNFPAVAREKVVLTVGAIQTRKNVSRLVQAFESLDREWKLVLAGTFGYGAEETRARIERSPARDRIFILGYVTPGDLAQWYARASIFAFPSLDEGFGMPLLEAMSAGTPVLTSNRAALPEVAGDSALLVDPCDQDALTHGLVELAANEALRGDLATRGLARAGQFTWKKAVRETWNVYRELAG